MLNGSPCEMVRKEIMIEMRAMALDDLDTLQAMSIETFKDTFGADNSAEAMDAFLTSAYSLEQLHDELVNPESFFYFAMQNKSIVGYVKLNIGDAQTEAQGPDALEIQKIYVLPAYKRQGIGNALIQQVLAIAATKYKSKVWLGVWERNLPALAFYKQCGFEKIWAHVFELGDEQQTDYIMQKVLDNNNK